MKYFIVVAHPDEEALDDDTHAALNFLGVSKEYKGKFPIIEMNTVPHLQLVQYIEAAIRVSEPDIVITHHPADTNNDHLQTSMACQEAIRLAQHQPSVKPLKVFWYMVVPSCHPCLYIVTSILLRQSFV